MANRRLLNPKGFHRVARHHYHQFPKAWLLTLSLALVSCLISIQCASFVYLPEAGNQKQQQAWRELKDSLDLYDQTQSRPQYQQLDYGEQYDTVVGNPLDLSSTAYYLSLGNDQPATAINKPQAPLKHALEFSEDQLGRPLSPTVSLLPSNSYASDSSSSPDLDESDSEKHSDFENLANRLAKLIEAEPKQLSTSLVLDDLKDTDQKERFLYLPDRLSSEQQQLSDIADLVSNLAKPSDEAIRDTLASADSTDAKANLTTLLEDDLNDIEQGNKRDGSSPTTLETSTTTTTTTTKAPETVKIATINATGDNATHSKNTPQWNSMIGGVLKSLASYLPFISTGWNSKAHETPAIFEPTINNTATSVKHTRPSDVSGPALITRESNDKQGVEASESSSHQVISVSPSVVMGGAIGSDSKRLDQQLPRVSLMRQSSLAPIAYTSNDQLISTDEASHNTLSDYLMNQAVEQQQQQPYRHLPYQLFQASSPYMRHYRPGDDVYGSYSQPSPSLRPPPGIFGNHQDMLMNPNGPMNNNNNNKTNDIYFLVMVGAFCMMAVAMVLSAGLFAYRVQQSRRMAAEQDYPTYGVVGPNNINGKCGNASFMGSYFTGSPGLGSNSASSSKTASAKYLPDYADATGMNTKTSNGTKGRNNELGAGPNNNSVSASAAASNVGRSSSGFMVDNQNAARMYHYQHQKQQMIISDRATAGRHTSASDLDSEDENDDGSYTVYECPGLASAHEMEIKNPLFNDDRTP